jgi:hypothetical protein
MQMQASLRVAFHVEPVDYGVGVFMKFDFDLPITWTSLHPTTTQI